MKTKLLLMAALVSAATLSANAGVRVGFYFGLPVPVVAAPAPVIVGAPVVVAPVVPAPAVVTAPTVVAPAPVVYGANCAVWDPGYWGYRHGVRVWFGPGWHPCGWHR